MRLFLIAVGRARKGPEQALFDHYAGRLSRPVLLKEVEEKRSLPAPELKKKEGQLLMRAIPGGSTVAALDERGRSLSSVAFAQRLRAWQDEGVRDLAFLVGGAAGLDGKVRDRADFVFSLGAFTWPHMLVRGLLVEQLFRAQCILTGHPYHRE